MISEANFRSSHRRDQTAIKTYEHKRHRQTTHTHTRFMMKRPPRCRFLRASLYCTVVSSAIMTSLRDQTPPSARKWMSVIPSFFTQIDECHHLFPPACWGHTVHGGPHPFCLLYWPWWGKSSDIIQDRTKQGPGSLWRCFHFPRKLNHLERLFSDGGLR